jgi:hypothetical protein
LYFGDGDGHGARVEGRFCADSLPLTHGHGQGKALVGNKGIEIFIFIAEKGLFFKVKMRLK